jgi:hypothetical protein
MWAQGGLPSYTWSVSSGSLPNGLTLNQTTGTISGQPTTVGTYAFTVMVTDSQVPAAQTTANLSIIIMSCTNNSMLSGNYAVAMEGWNFQPGQQGPSVQSTVAASFVADGAGHITSGSLDTNDDNGPQTGTFTGAYCVGASNFGLMTLNLSNNTTYTYAIAVNSNGSNGRIMFFDGSTMEAVGPIRKQTTSAFSTGAINGNYSFGLIGVDSSAGKRFGMAGEFDSNGAGTLSGMADQNDNGGIRSQVTLSASNFSVLSSTTGRGKVTITFNVEGGETYSYVFYVVNAGELLLMGDDTAPSNLTVGQALQQTAGGFTDAALDGNFIVGMQSLALDQGNVFTPEVTGGIATASGNGSSFGINFTDNNGGTVSTMTGTGTYSVASNGRVTLSGLGSGAPVLYLVAKNQGFAIGTDHGVGFGQFYPQTGSNFNNGSLNATFTGGSDYPEDLNVNTNMVSVAANGAGSLTGTSEDNNFSSGGPEADAISASYSVSSNGEVVVSQGGYQIGVMYIVNTGEVLFIPASLDPNNPDSNPSLAWFLK